MFQHDSGLKLNMQFTRLMRMTAADILFFYNETIMCATLIPMNKPPHMIASSPLKYNYTDENWKRLSLPLRFQSVFHVGE